MSLQDTLEPALGQPDPSCRSLLSAQLSALPIPARALSTRSMTKSPHCSFSSASQASDEPLSALEQDNKRAVRR